jgi:hypothetical protein
MVIIEHIKKREQNTYNLWPEFLGFFHMVGGLFKGALTY